jgi:hypothetical protein
MNKVFLSLIEIRPLEGCELDPEEIAGAFVRVYVPAPSKDVALTLVKKTLAEMAMQLIDVQWCCPFDEVEWENPDDQVDKDHVAEAAKTGEIAFDDFHVWGHDAPDADESD